MHSSLLQHQLVDAKVKLANECEKEILSSMKKHAISTKETNDVNIAGDWNQSVKNREARRFHNSIGVKNASSC